MVRLPLQVAVFIFPLSPSWGANMGRKPMERIAPMFAAGFLLAALLSTGVSTAVSALAVRAAAEPLFEVGAGIVGGAIAAILFGRGSKATDC